MQTLTRLRANPNDPSQLHPLYIKHQHQVNTVNNVYNGSDSMKDYLFQFPQEQLDTFRTRQERATLRNFVHRAVSAFTGMIFRKPIEVSGYGARTTRLFPRIDTQQNLSDFAKQLTSSITKDGKVYILIDSSKDGESAPYMTEVLREQVINWRKDANNHFTMVVIRETITIEDGLFGSGYITQYRHIQADGTVTIYRSVRDQENRQVNGNQQSNFYVHEVIETEYPSIPLVEVSLADIPILYDTALMNIKHYNRQSHKDRYLTMAALPIPVVWGAEIDEETQQATTIKPALVIGVDEAFVFSSKEDGDFQWRELSGTSVNLLEDDLNSITEDITTGILRAAETANSVQKTATEVALLQSEASNRVSSIAISIENGIREALTILSTFNNETVPASATFKLSSDFNAALSGTDGTRIVFESYLQGLVSIETYLNALAEAELIEMESAAKELERIKADNFVPQPKVQGADSSMDNRTKSAINAGDTEKDEKKMIDKKRQKTFEGNPE